ncbi:MAG: hypothetical protein WKI04_19310 [Ferruginibacter sp.]
MPTSKYFEFSYLVHPRPEDRTYLFMEEKLSITQIQQFIADGYIKLENAFPESEAKKALQILWKDTHCDPVDPATWKKL